MRLIDADALVEALMAYTWRDEDERLIDDADEKRTYIKQWLPDLPPVEPLKEQEPRILDIDELEDWDNAVWFEEKDERDCYIALTANVGTYDATFVNVEPGNLHRLDFLREFYKKEWRCWSARPTIKQRLAVKWNA